MKQFQVNAKIALLSLALLAGLIFLGYWQLHRAQEKHLLEEKYHHRQAAEARPINELDWMDKDLAFYRVNLSGSYDRQHYFLLDNRMYQGKVGYEVISPFTFDTNKLVFVNRGWVPQGASRSELPIIAPIEKNVHIVANIYVPSGENFILKADTFSLAAKQPQVIQSVEVAAMAQLFDKQIFPYSIRLAPNAPGLLQRNWAPISIKPEKHRAYAVQWFAMAVALVLLLIRAGFRLGK